MNSTEHSLSELTLPELRLAMAPELAEAAVFDGWTNAALQYTAEGMGVDYEVAKLAFKGGPMAMIEAWIETVDRSMAAAFPSDVIEPMKIRERIRALVQFRLDEAQGLEEAVRRATTIMAMPQNVARSARRSWRSADIMWRLAGDTATDYNHYTKRAILSSIYAATLAIFVNDSSEDKAETKAFLDRRIDGVMKFEKAKAKWLPTEPRERFSVARFLGRLRYPEAAD